MFPDSKYLGSYSYRHCTKVRAQLRLLSCCSGWVFANLSLRDELMIRNQFISGKYGDPPPALPSPPTVPLLLQSSGKTAGKKY